MTAVFSFLKARSGDKIDQNVLAFIDLMVTPTMRALKCVHCGTITKKVRGAIAIHIPPLSHESPVLNVEQWMASLFLPPNTCTRLLPHHHSLRLVCSSCSNTGICQQGAVLYRAHHFPRILTLRFDIPAPPPGSTSSKFGKTLDLTSYCLPGRERPLHYILSGIVVSSFIDCDLGSSTRSGAEKFISYVRQRQRGRRQGAPGGDEEQEQDEEDCWFKFDGGEPVVRVAERQVWEDSQGGQTDSRSNGNIARVIIYERRN
eukprot:CAMPEP_0116999178 /NCGR_PEP_ID=MMETSP0472-20121206/1989_1 /TAXON_ID=693140 ORGANISM="Tiarina fusus, Strain LIS" /NCGR_SAMPLE_ID=MMETSP0472 /ASSEMBLY_ACC=CAM_ASM_000603 /LENGTH=258 /DNA_ID=CAMNT_0004698549 /DNA_START=490 /DNA_END=1267 /DNA_ORIENTATION=-